MICHCKPAHPAIVYIVPILSRKRASINTTAMTGDETFALRSCAFVPFRPNVLLQARAGSWRVALQAVVRWHADSNFTVSRKSK